MVSEPCQITWFSYTRIELTVGGLVSEPCQITWFSYLRAPTLDGKVFQSRARSPGSLTSHKEVFL